MDLNSVRRSVQNFGVWNTAFDLGLRSLNRVALFKVLQGVSITKVDPSCLEIDGRYTHGFLSEAQLRRFAQNPSYELTTAFLDEALGRGDECYAILDGEVLAAYGWYSHRPTKIDPEDLVLHFDPAYIYMYKGFTHPGYRGQRLHSIGMSWALERYLERGFRGMVSYVEANNFSSLRSCYRMGYRGFGQLYVARLFAGYLLHATAACAQYGFELRRLGAPSRTSVPATTGASFAPAEMRP